MGTNGPDPNSRQRMRDLWRTMWRRCTNSRSADYAHYGARGIRVAEQWRNFDVFIADVGPRPSLRHTLDRKDGTGNYEPGNVRWATPREQRLNERDVRFISWKGRTLCIRDWERELGFPPKTIYARLARGYSPERALAEPLERQHRITESDVLDIRTLAAFGASVGALSEGLGLHEQTVRSVLKRRTWRHVA